MIRLDCPRIALLLLLVSGCMGGSGKGRPDFYPVSGTVIYKGTPVQGATVTFHNEGAPRVATGITDDEGKFVLSSFEYNDGAIVGEHKITVTKVEGGAPAASAADTQKLLDNPTALTQMAQAHSQGEGTGQPTGPKSLLPEKYGSVATSPLKETVGGDNENTFVLELAD